MRVISGCVRGHKLKAPEGLSTRPTTDRIKESLFNIINMDLYECRFLDLFSGSGGIGIEALSRGASKSVFVDSDKKSVDVIKDNLISTRLMEKASVLNCDVLTALKRLGQNKEKFDIIFLDPPYNMGLTEKALKMIVSEDLLEKDGYIIAEQAKEEPSLNINGLDVFRIKDYKITKMTFLENLEK